MAQRSIVRTKAVVLRSIDYGETSQIVTLFTQKKGKIGVMAKGARRPKSSFGATLQPMAYTQVVFYYKPARTLQTLSESSHVQSFHRLRGSLLTITVGLRIVELVDALMEKEDPQPMAFGLMVRALHRLNHSEVRVGNLWPFVQLQLAQMLGVAPAVERARVEAVTGEEGLLSLADGGVYPTDATPERPTRASRSALRAYAVCARADLDTVMRLDMAPAVRREVNALVRDFLRYQFDDAYPDRSRSVIAQIERAGAPGSGQSHS
ncbi:DNA repair protein RecO [Salinibacter altiplanensis]|uniref:DNA repair protein RecO n=1 Tax=Salinibacter altiplanensis TaxID=1803181 RepID=UPI000C9EF113|nr:DNA repair protein RecO [Salinibacter altiplanensis]